MTEQPETPAPSGDLALPTEFSFENQAFRTVVQDNAPWFVAKDVCDILGLKNPSQAIKRLDDDEKGLNSIYTLGGPQNVAMVNESGLYRLIFRSDKPAARRFSKTVTSEILPQIRKTGEYRQPSGATAKTQYIGPDHNDHAIDPTFNLVAAFYNLQRAWQKHYDMLGYIAAVTIVADENRAAFTKAVVNDEIAVHCPECQKRLEGHKILRNDQFDTVRFLALKVEEFSIECNRDWANISTIRSAFAYTIEQIDAFERAMNPPGDVSTTAKATL